MGDLLAQFKSAQKKIQLRERAADEAINVLEGENKETLRKGIFNYNIGFFALRVLPLTFIGTLLLTPFLQRKSPFLIKEISLVAGISSGILYGDYRNSDYFWSQCGSIIMENTNYNDMGMNPDQMEKMKKLYEKSKQYKPELKSEKMYE